MKIAGEGIDRDESGEIAVGVVFGITTVLSDKQEPWLSLGMRLAAEVREYLRSDRCHHQVARWQNGQTRPESRPPASPTSLANRVAAHPN